MFDLAASRVAYVSRRAAEPPADTMRRRQAEAIDSISEEVQVDMKAGLVGTHLDLRVSEDAQQDIKQALGAVRGAHHPSRQVTGAVGGSIMHEHPNSTGLLLFNQLNWASRHPTPVGATMTNSASPTGSTIRGSPTGSITEGAALQMDQTQEERGSVALQPQVTQLAEVLQRERTEQRTEAEQADQIASDARNQLDDMSSKASWATIRFADRGLSRFPKQGCPRAGRKEQGTSFATGSRGQGTEKTCKDRGGAHNTAWHEPGLGNSSAHDTGAFVSGQGFSGADRTGAEQCLWRVSFGTVFLPDPCSAADRHRCDCICGRVCETTWAHNGQLPCHCREDRAGQEAGQRPIAQVRQCSNCR